MNAVDDAVDCVRKEVARAGELQYQSNQSVNIRVSELDEKLFALDKELLKIKLALPSAISAQMSTPFSNHASFSTGKAAELPTGALALQQTLQEISLDIASLYVASACICRYGVRVDLELTLRVWFVACAKGKQIRQRVALQIASSLVVSRIG